MRPLAALAIYLTVIFGGAATLAPCLYWLAQSLAASHPSFENLARQEFHRYVSRTLLILALAGLAPFLRSLGIRRLADAGLSSWRGQGGLWMRGFLMGFISLAVIAGLALVVGAREFNHERTGGQLIRAGLVALVSALVVSTLEEILFRGGILGALRRSLGWGWALFLSSTIYALVHFFARPERLGEIHWYSGWSVLGSMLGGFGDFHTLIPGFLNLALAGVLLGVAWQRTGNLYCSMGLHAGWIFWLKFYGYTTNELPAAAVWVWGTRKLVDGWVALPILLLVGGVMHRRLRAGSESALK
jgi:membrane protease YdiL (CAAX protease family)